MDHSNQLRKMNQQNREFWAREIPQLPARMSDAALREIALKFMQAEQLYLPAYYQTELSEWVTKAEMARRIILSHQATKGGSVKKADKLQQAIEQIVRRRPAITVQELTRMLTRERFPDLIQDVEDERIYFPRNDPNAPLKSASISGLKDRLWRAKRALKSR